MSDRPDDGTLRIEQHDNVVVLTVGCSDEREAIELLAKIKADADRGYIMIPIYGKRADD